MSISSITKYKSTPYVRSAEVEKLVKKYRTLNQGDIITYEDIASIVGVHPQKGGYGLMNSARRIVFNESGIVLVSVTNIGLKRATEIDISVKSDSHIDRAKKQVDLGFKTHMCRDVDKMTDDERRKHDTKSAHLYYLTKAMEPNKRLTAESPKHLP